MKIGIIILCRFNSTRLPGKILRKVKGRAILGNIHKRLLNAKSVDTIIVATSAEKSDDVIVNYCNEHEIACYRGSLTNVSERFMNCAVENQLDYAIRINGDNVLIDTDTLEYMVTQCTQHDLKFCSNVPKRTFPFGMSIEIVKTNFYKKCYTQFSQPGDFEHVTKYLYDNLTANDEIYFHQNTKYPELKGVQMAVDTEEDLKNIRSIADRLEKFPFSYSMKTVSSILNSNK